MIIIFVFTFTTDRSQNEKIGSCLLLWDGLYVDQEIGFSMVLTFFCPWTLNLYIAIGLLCLRVQNSVEIKRYNSQIRMGHFKYYM